MPDVDSALVTRSGVDMATNFNELVLLYQDSIFNYVCKMIGRNADAEDLAQEVFVRAYQSRTNFRGDCSARTWLFRIATNLCVDVYRKRARRPQNMISLDQPIDPDQGEDRHEIPDWSNDPQKLLEIKDLEHHIQSAIASLPEKLRAVILLHDYEDLSYEDIAEITRCPLGTVKSRLFNARMRLREKLQPYLDG